MPVIQALLLFALCFAAAVLALLVTALLQRQRGLRRAGLFADAQQDLVLLFDGETLLDATAGGRALLAASRSGGSQWQSFLGWAVPRFPRVEEQLGNLAALGRITLVSAEAEGPTLRAEWRGGIMRITLLEPHVDSRGAMVDALTQRALEAELESLRDLTDKIPVPIWREDGRGAVTWGNQAYLSLAMARLPESEAILWPLPQMIAVDGPGRTSVGLVAGRAPLWFDCHVAPLPDGRMVFALPADAAVQAEQALGNFVQTLTKTFAQLPIGLAIFDRARRLQLFNPALTDLTGLAPDFLLARPTLFSLLDAMRAAGMLPEPRDYKAWRARLAALEKSAMDGGYEETWALATGQTYRVTGRPHPEGALALLVQDISDETTRARRMRADLELGQSVIDATDEAIAVISSAGQLVMSNTAYASLWGHDPSEALAEQSLAALVEVWRAACAPNGFWALSQAFVAGTTPRHGQSLTARLHDGRLLACRVAPLAAGATLIGFALEPGPRDGQDPGVRLVADAAPVAQSRTALSGG